MSTFIGQLIGFAVIVWIIMKYVAPPVRTLMAERQEAVRTQLEESSRAAQRLSAADQYHAERVEEGRSEAQHIVGEASSDSVRIAEQLRALGGVEAERIKVYGGQQALLLRAQLIRQLRGELGGESVRRATEIVKAYVADPQAQSSTVDRFLDELEAMTPAAAPPEVMSSDMRSASRDAQAVVVARFEELSASLSPEQLSLLADELTSVDQLLLREPILTRHLAEATGETEGKRQMLDRLLGGRVDATTLELLATAVSVRWSSTKDFVSCLEHVARLSLLARAGREGQADEVAEQLFRFSRVLDSEPRLTTLLSDYGVPASDRVSLLRGVLDRASGTNATAAALLTQTVQLMRGERADEAVADLAQLAVASRGEVVAQVSAAAEISDAQRARLTELLSRIYRNPVSVQLTIDPALLGGLAVAVGDEVIDGTLSSRLAAAATKLPD